MKFGIREICDVVLKAKAAQKIGNKIFYANEPVLYFDTLKSSSMEGASTTVYAQGGRGNTRLVAWEGERTVTFTMEDALISPEGFMILTGAGLIEADGVDNFVYQHMTETVDAKDFVNGTYTNNSFTVPATTVEEGDDGETPADTSAIKIPLDYKAWLPKDEDGDYAYVMLVKNGEIISEPLIPVHTGAEADHVILVKAHENYNDAYEDETGHTNYTITEDMWKKIATCDSVIVDYYIKHSSDAKQIEISAESFGGNFYLEASTLFRDTNGSDLPAEFVIPNCKIQSNFNFSMASSGDPSTFTFTMDAFPDYTRWDRSKKVLAAIQIFGADAKTKLHRHSTGHETGHDEILKNL